MAMVRANPDAIKIEVILPLRDELAAEICGLQRFPMRPHSRQNEELKRKENALANRFDAGHDNLFALSLDPSQYRGREGLSKDESLYEFFIENREKPRAELESFLDPKLLTAMVDASLCRQSDNRLTMNWRLIPHQPIDHQLDPFIFIADAYAKIHDLVYLSFDSLFFVNYLHEFTRGRQFSQVVDLGTGSGIIGIVAARHLKAPCLGVDMNARALAIAKLNAQLNGVSAQFVEQDFAKVPIQEQSLITANPPFVFIPDDKKAALHSDGGKLGMAATLSILENFQALDKGSEALMITSSLLFRAAKELALMSACRSLKNLDIEFWTLDRMPPFAQFAASYEKAGVQEVQQVLLKVKKSAGATEIRDMGPLPLSKNYSFG